MRNFIGLSLFSAGLLLSVSTEAMASGHYKKLAEARRILAERQAVVQVPVVQAPPMMAVPQIPVPAPVAPVPPIMALPPVVAPAPVAPLPPVMDLPPIVAPAPVAPLPPVMDLPPIVAPAPVAPLPPVMALPPVVAPAPVAPLPPVMALPPVVAPAPVAPLPPVMALPPVVAPAPVAPLPPVMALPPVVAPAPVAPLPPVMALPPVVAPAPVAPVPPVMALPPVVAPAPVAPLPPVMALPPVVAPAQNDVHELLADQLNAQQAENQLAAEDLQDLLGSDVSQALQENVLEAQPNEVEILPNPDAIAPISDDKGKEGLDVVEAPVLPVITQEDDVLIEEDRESDSAMSSSSLFGSIISSITGFFADPPLRTQEDEKLIQGMHEEAIAPPLPPQEDDEVVPAMIPVENDAPQRPPRMQSLLDAIVGQSGNPLKKQTPAEKPKETSLLQDALTKIRSVMGSYHEDEDEGYDAPETQVVEEPNRPYKKGFSSQAPKSPAVGGGVPDVASLFGATADRFLAKANKTKPEDESDAIDSWNSDWDDE